MSESELYVPPEDGVPETPRDGFWFRVGWKWATSTALENGWLERGEAAQLQAHGNRLADEAKERRGQAVPALPAALGVACPVCWAYPNIRCIELDLPDAPWREPHPERVERLRAVREGEAK